MINKNLVLGVGINSVTRQKVLEFLLKGLKKGTKKLFVVTPNSEILVRAHHNARFKQVLNNASLALPDGTGVIWAGKLLGKKFKEKITGVDIMENLCQKAADYGLTVGFLGGGPKIAERTSECLRKKYPKLRIIFAKSGGKINESGASEEKNGRDKIPPVDILFVAFGAPKQEFWISRHLDQLPIKVAIGVGGAFDYFSGRVLRAPKLIQKAGFEWLFRLILEPWRFKRQLALLEFIFLVLRERIRA